MWLVSHNRVSAVVANKAKSSYSNFTLNMAKVNKSTFTEFKKSGQ